MRNPFPPDRSVEISQHLADTFYQEDPFKIKRPPVGRNKYIIMKDGNTDRVEEVKELIVHTFNVGDVEDPDLYAAEPLFEWEKSEPGQWVMKHALETPSWYRAVDFHTFGYKYHIKAKFAGVALTELLLRQGSK
jgi:hypothetical protein